MHGEHLQRGIANNLEGTMLRVAKSEDRGTCRKNSVLLAWGFHLGTLDHVCSLYAMMEVEVRAFSRLELDD